MKTTGIYTEHQFEIPFKSWNKPIYIIPFGDVHWGDKACDEETFLEDIRWGKGRDDVWYLGMGDYFDALSTSERDILGNPALHEATKDDLSDMYRARADAFLDHIDHCKGRIIGMIEGNHFAKLDSGVTTTQYMCEKLKCKYLGVMSAIRLNFVCGNQRINYDIIAHHGMGAARLSGGSLNRVEQMNEGWDADLFLMGHDHKMNASKTARCSLENHARAGLRIVERTVISARTGSYLRGFIKGRACYNADAARRPLPLGGIRIEITPRSWEKDGRKFKKLMPKVIA